MRVYLLLIVVMWRGLLAHADNIDARLSAIADKSAALQAKIVAGENPLGLNSVLTNADRDVIQFVDSLLMQSLDMERAAITANGHIVFRPMPKSITINERIAFQQDGGDSIVVDYRRYDMSDGSALFFCENTFPGITTRYGRLCPSIYVVHVKDGHTNVSSFRDFDEVIGSGMRSYDGAPMLLDVLPANGAYPKAILLEGPSGSGQFAKLHVFSYDEKSNAWLRSNSLELAAVRNYRYTDETKEFTFTIYEDDRLKHFTVNLRDAVSRDASKCEWITSIETN